MKGNSRNIEFYDGDEMLISAIIRFYSFNLVFFLSAMKLLPVV